MTRYAAQTGQLEVLVWARAQEPPAPWSKAACFGAAAEGHLEVLQWLHQQQCPWNKAFCERIARRNGQLHVLHWLQSLDKE